MHSSPAMALRFCLLCALAILAVPATAAAQTQTGPAYRLETGLDVPLVVGGAALASSYFFLDEAPGVACGLTCDRSRVNAFDRWAAGRYSVAWSRVGDVATAATLLFPPLVLVLDEGWKNGSNDSVVVAESALLTSALQVTLSYAVARPRPRVYSDAAPLEDRTDANAARSFFSGHVANTVAATVTATVALHRVGRSTLGWLVLGGGLAGSSLVGISRVLSGGHFPSDVLVGGAVGTGVGLLVPYLHTSHAAVSPFTADNTKGVLVSGAW